MPLKKHSSWVIHDGIFSTTPKIVKNESNVTVGIIRGEGLKNYSVADELIKWSKLKVDGVITDKQFEDAKAKLLEGNKS
ncbi:SHOCT domain-containing protein [Endozoicomonas numazuensis]|uniref:SHOCT domain-containing protein n=1 Tax=Endozoicomonas numazuensis TaxID=1137799 RepID=UPI00068C92B5|nr:SHOCT domain-containing protein [Endozoicomonas numazuensis]